MKVYVGADHGGFVMKEKIREWLTTEGYEVEDCGAFQLDPTDDYPEYAFVVAEKVASSPDAVGILVCRSGGGMSIAANKVHGIRAVDVFDLTSAIHAKTHNNANIISIGADWMEPEETKLSVANFLKSVFEGEERHVRRLNKIAEYEGKKMSS